MAQVVVRDVIASHKAVAEFSEFGGTSAGLIGSLAVRLLLVTHPATVPPDRAGAARFAMSVRMAYAPSRCCTSASDGRA